MSIKMRLILMSVIIFLSIAILTALGYMGNQRLKNIINYSNELAQLRTLLNVDSALLNMHTQYLLTLQHNPKHPDIVAMHDHPETMHFNQVQQFEAGMVARLNEFVAHPAAKPFLNKAQDFQQKIEVYRQSVAQGLDLFKAVEYDKANYHLLTKMNPQLRDALKATSDFRQDLVKLSQATQVEAEAFVRSQTNLMLFVGAIFLLILGALSWYITRSIQGGISDTVQAVTRIVASMQFDTQLKPRKDELNKLASALNELFASLRLSINETNKVVGAIAQGEFDKRIHSQLNGDLALLKQGVNASAESVAFMMNELELVMNALDQGQFDVKMDERVPVGFREKVEHALENINVIIQDINRVMSKMEQGKFQHRVEVAAKGELDVLKNRVNGSLQALAEAMSEITAVTVAQSQGDLTQTIKGDYHGELRLLKDAINTTVMRLDGIVSVAVEAARIVNENSNEVSQGALDLSQRVQEQAASLEQTSSAMEQMNAAIHNNTEHAQTATELASEMQKDTAQGSQVMQQTIEAMNAIQESSHKISDIVTLIDGIAFQTNLLALNAAVEAARAGEHGRGFAVVAGEVRALAQKSAEAAKDIKTLISESVTRIDQGTKLASASGEVFSHVTESINDVTNKINQIAHASKEQTVGIGQVHQAITSIDSVTQQNAALVEQTSAAAESMRDQATNLMEKMAFFKTTSARQGARPKALAAKVKPASLSAPSEQSLKKNVSADKKPLNKPTAQAAQGDEWAEF